MTGDVNKINEKDRAYFAGLFDGEGCVVIQKGTPAGQNTTYSLNVNFNITYASVLYEMKRLFRGNVYKVDMEKVKNYKSSKRRIESDVSDTENYKQKYIFSLNSKEAWVFLKIIEPDCREKKEQARTGIEFFNGYIGGRGHTLSKSQIERCEYYYKKLQELKKSSNEKNDDILEFKDSQQTLSFCSER